MIRSIEFCQSAKLTKCLEGNFRLRQGCDSKVLAKVTREVAEGCVLDCLERGLLDELG